MPAFSCRANVSGMCANFESVSRYPSLYLKQLKKIQIRHLTILTTRLYCRCINRLVILNHLATDSSHNSWLRFRIKCIFHPKQAKLVEVRSQIQAMALLSKTVPHFLCTLMNEQILDIVYGWTTILYAG
jgi:hypothetical protein